MITCVKSKEFINLYWLMSNLIWQYQIFKFFLILANYCFIFYHLKVVFCFKCMENACFSISSYPFSAHPFCTNKLISRLTHRLSLAYHIKNCFRKDLSFSFGNLLLFINHLIICQTFINNWEVKIIFEQLNELFWD